MQLIQASVQMHPPENLHTDNISCLTRGSFQHVDANKISSVILWKQRPWTAKGYYKPKTKEGGGEERYAIREEQDKYKPRARDTSLWHLFRPPREKNENNMNQKMHHEKKLTCKAHESEPSNATSEMTRLNNAAVSSFFVVCLNALIIRGDEWIGHVFRLEELLVLDIWIWFPKRPHTLVTFQAAPCLQLL